MTSWRSGGGAPPARFPPSFPVAPTRKPAHGGQVRSCAVLVATGIDPNGKRSILGVSVSLSGAEVHWRDFLASLHARGLHGVKLVVSDAHAGLKPALDARLTGVPWQRCQFHLMLHFPKLNLFGVSRDVPACSPADHAGRHALGRRQS